MLALSAWQHGNTPRRDRGDRRHGDVTAAHLELCNSEKPSKSNASAASLRPLVYLLRIYLAFSTLIRTCNRHPQRLGHLKRQKIELGVVKGLTNFEGLSIATKTKCALIRLRQSPQVPSSSTTHLVNTLLALWRSLHTQQRQEAKLVCANQKGTRLYPGDISPPRPCLARTPPQRSRSFAYGKSAHDPRSAPRALRSVQLRLP